ncbi:MAG: LTA synthase family protein [Candidatus Zixiibacteriota bacterium]
MNLLYLVIFTIPLWTRMYHVESYVSEKTGYIGTGAWMTLLNDGIVYAFVFFMLYLAFAKFTKRTVSIFLKLFMLIVLLLNITDVVIIKNFNAHLTLSDILKYSPYLDDSMQFIGILEAIGILIGIMIIVVILMAFIMDNYKTKEGKRSKVFLITAILFALLSFFRFSNQYSHSWMFRNVYEYNVMLMSEAAGYSSDFRKELLDYKEKRICIENEPHYPNIIILMVESLSNYQSEYFSGIRDWTPNLDSIARENCAFRNFYANGFITEDGSISILTGKFPIYAPASYSRGGSTSFNGFYDMQQAMPGVLSRHGYSTEFITTANLGFSNTGEWAESIGFDYVEGHEHPYYDNFQRYHFKAAPDAALMDRLLQRVDEKEDDEKFFIFSKTVTSHHPFINPESGKKDAEAEVFQYTDRQIGRFYNSLDSMNYFDSGILIITGDHHAMLPFKKEEIEKYGSQKAQMMVPLVIVDGRNCAYDQPMQQIDVYNSIKNLVSNKLCYSEWRGHLFEPKIISPKYIAARRGDNRTHVSVFNNGKHYLIKLKGDKTKIVEPEEIADNIENKILDKINSTRISAALRRERQSDYDSGLSEK